MIKEVVLAEFENDKNSEEYMDLVKRLYINEDSIKKAVCYIDSDTAIDVKNGKTYHIINRNKDMRILPSELNKIKKDKLYVIEVTNREFSKVSIAKIIYQFRKVLSLTKKDKNVGKMKK